MREEQMPFDDPIIAEIEKGQRRRCGGMKVDGQRCRRKAPAWYEPTAMYAWFCATHKEQERR